MDTISLSEINIRETLHPGDLGYIAFMHGDLYGKELGYGLNFEAYVLGGLQDFAHHYDAKRNRVWLCEHRGQIIGSLVAQHRGQSIQLRYFILYPAYRSIGLGKKLMDGFMFFMKSSGYTHAYLWTTNEQHAAIALYRRFGFTLTEEKPSNAFNKSLTEQRYDVTLA